MAFFAVSALLLGAAVASGLVQDPGILAAALTFSLASGVQAVWLAVRARGLTRPVA